MDYMEKAWEVSLKVAAFYAEEKYTDKNGLVWLGIEGETHDEDCWLREDALVSMSSSDMMKKMINELNGWDETPVKEDPYEYGIEISDSKAEGGTRIDEWFGTVKEAEAGLMEFQRVVKRRKAGKVQDV